MNLKQFLFSQFISTNQTLSENLQPVCSFLLYMCPPNATFDGRGGDKNINSHPHSKPQKNSVNFKYLKFTYIDLYFTLFFFNSFYVGFFKKCWI